MTTWWIAFNIFVLFMLALDLGVFHRKAHVVSVREAMKWTLIWVSLALVFNLGIYLGWIGNYTPAETGPKALEFLTGYLLEKSLSVDNIFVIALLFGYFKVPPQYQHRVLFWGILGALIMRAILIFAGIALIENFHWIIYVFGLILVVSGVKMWFTSDEDIDPSENRMLKFIRKVFPVSRHLDGQKFTTFVDGKKVFTPLFVVLLFIEWTDVIFAVDSIPAILAVTHDPFIVYTSNVMAILGLRSLYFALAGIMDRFHLLHYGLSAILVFVGIKMIIVDFYKFPTLLSLGVIAGILLVSLVASFLIPKKPDAKSEEKHLEDA